MSEIHQLISDITAFMAGSNRSYTPRLKKMYETYRALCAELAGQLEKCRDLMSRGLEADARNYNLRQNPSLTERFDLLNIPCRREFIALCEDYDLPPIPLWDESVVLALKSPVSDGEVRNASLMQRWRKIARSGKPAEKIHVLRQIVAQTNANDVSWKRNLAEAEKVRYAEIEALLPKIAGAEDELEQLEKMSLELFSPELLTHPKDELVTRLKERMLPLQKKKLELELDKVLDEMQNFYESHDVQGMKGCFEKWRKLSSNPLVITRPEQEQTVQDAMAYVAQVEEEDASERKYQELLKELTALLEKEAPYPELERVYGMLQRMERELPQMLVAQMETKESDAREQEHRLHVRRCIYGVALAVLFLVLTLVGIRLLQHRNLVRQTCLELQRQKDAGLYEEGLKVFEELKTRHPRVARSAKVMALQVELANALQARNETIASDRKEFAQLLETMNGYLKRENLDSAELDELLDRAEKIRENLTDEQREQLIRMMGDVSQAKERLRKKRESDFIAGSERLAKMALQIQESMNGNHEIGIGEIKARREELKRQITQLLVASKVDAGLLNAKKDHLEKMLSGVDFMVSEEEKYRQNLQKLENPASFDAYLETLEKIREMPEEIQQMFLRAQAHAGQWKIENEDSDKTFFFLSDSKTASDHFTRYGARSLFMAEYRDNCHISSSDPLPEELPKILKSCDLYELVFRNQSGEPFYFYCKNEPQLEMSKINIGNVNYIVANLELDGKSTLGFFKYLRKEGKFEISFPSRQVKWDGPVTFDSLDGWTEAESRFHKCSVQGLARILTASGTSSLREKTAFDVLDYCEKASGMNPRLKTQVLRLALKSLLSAKDGFYKSRLAPLMKELDGIPDGDWRMQDAAFKEKYGRLMAEYGRLDWRTIRELSDFQNAFLTALYKKQLYPLGILLLKDGKVQVKPFGGAAPRELLVIENGKMHRLFTPVAGGPMAPQDKDWVFQGQVVWGYVDGQTCEEFFKEWRDKAEKNKMSLSSVQTHLCPEEYRYLMK